MAGGEGLEEMEGFPQRDSFQYMLGDLLKLPGDTFTSIYDLVDDWKHIVKLRTFCQIETITLMAITRGCSSEP